MSPTPAARVGRNEPCPCGSGLKYKKCCGANVPVVAASPTSHNARIQWRDAAVAAVRGLADTELARRIDADESLLTLPSPRERMRLAEWLQSRGFLLQALEVLREAQAQAPDSLPLLNALAEALIYLERPAAAVALLEPVLASQPSNVHTLCSLGLANTALGRHEQSVAWLQRAASLAPDKPAVLNNLGSALQAAGRALEALAAFGRAAELQPAVGVYHGNVGRTLLSLLRADDALASHARQMAADPRNAVAYSEMLFTMNYSDRVSPEQAFTAHRRCAELIEPPLLPRQQRHRPGLSGRRLRVGYVSSDLRRHSVAFFLEPLLQHHDASAFEVCAYFNHLKADAVTQRLRGACSRWREVAHWSDAELAQAIADDGIDILIDLNGHTLGNRLRVFALKPAPVQVAWLGYPNTTGLRSIDYRITDARADPPGASDHWHSEQLWRLPGCFVCYRPPEGAPPLQPREYGGPIRFGSFSNHSKISPSTVAAWARVLQAVPESSLILKLQGTEDASISRQLMDNFARHDIDPKRLSILGRLEQADDHLRRYESIDIALDTLPYAGTTTTCDALWMGVPVVTLAGQAHASRVGASLLGALGLDELVADDVEGFVATAVALARDEPRLRALHATLRKRMAGSRLTDGAAFARDFEAALQQMWAHRRPDGASAH